MNPIRLLGPVAVLSLGLLLGLARHAAAQVPLCVAPGAQDQVAAAAMDSSVVVTWRDNRYDPTDPYDIFVSRLNYYINPLWSPFGDGVDECGAIGTQSDPAIATGSDGVTWLCWRDYRTCTAYGQVWVQSIPPGGSPSCTPGSGSLVANFGCEDGMRDHAIISTGPGTGIIVWHRKWDSGVGGETYDEIWAQKLSASGCARQWGATGIRIASHGWISASKTTAITPSCVSDGSGGVIVVWYYSGVGRLFAQRVGPDGTVLWAGAVRLCTTEATQQNPSLASDGSGGLIVVWQQGNAGSRTILAQRIDNSGVRQWGDGGKVIAGSGGDLINPRIARSTLGRSFVVWEADYSAGNSDILAQRISFLGDTLGGRVPVCMAPYAQTLPQAAAGPNGDCLIVWQDGRDIVIGDDAHIYAQRLDAAGNALCDPNGWAFAAVQGTRQSNPIIVPVRIGGSSRRPGGDALVIWSDTRNGNPDIYAQAFKDTCPPIPLAVDGGPNILGGTTLRGAVPNPFARATWIQFSLDRRQPVSLRIYDMAGRLVRELIGSESFEAGNHQTIWDGLTRQGERARAGVYFCRLRAAEASFTRTVIVR